MSWTAYSSRTRSLLHQDWLLEEAVFWQHINYHESTWLYLSFSEIGSYKLQNSTKNNHKVHSLAFSVSIFFLRLSLLHLHIPNKNSTTKKFVYAPFINPNFIKTTQSVRYHSLLLLYLRIPLQLFINISIYMHEILKKFVSQQEIKPFIMLTSLTVTDSKLVSYELYTKAYGLSSSALPQDLKRILYVRLSADLGNKPSHILTLSTIK